MSRTLGQNFQDVNELPLKSLGQPARSQNDVIFDAIQRELESPLRMYASFPAADSKLNFSNSIVTTGDGANKVSAPVKKQVFDLAGAFIDFQNQGVSNPLQFDITWPATNTLGFYRRVGFSLIGSGKVKALFSAEFSTEAALPNAGGLLVAGATPIGYINIQCTNTLGYFKTPGSATNIIENAKVFRFGSGAGGGSGTGDANQFTENMKFRLEESYFKYFTASVFEVDESAYIESSTATYDLVDGVYTFAAGQNFISQDLLDDGFLLDTTEGLQVEAHAQWFDSASTDASATFEAAIDGVTYEAISMNRQDLTNTFVGRKRLSTPPNAGLLTQAAGATQVLNASNSISFSLNPTRKVGAREIKVYLTKTGTPSGTVTVSLKQGTQVLCSLMKFASDLSAGLNIITLNTFKAIMPAGTYQLVIETDSLYKSSYITGTTQISSNSQYDINGHIYELRLRVTSSASGKKLKAFGVFYDERLGNITDGIVAEQRIIFSGDLDQTVFPITNFFPSARRLKVYDIKAGQVYRWPSFNVDSKNVIFPSGTFNAPGNTIELLFDQSEGTGFDYSELNGLLLSANRLGSTDPSLDRSVTGRGILLRNKQGQLKELWIDGEAIYVTDPQS